MATYGKDIYISVGYCGTCTRNGTCPKTKRHLQLFLASGLLELVEIEILEALHCTVNGNKYKIVMNDRYAKLTRAMLTIRTSSSLVANVFFHL